MSPAAPTPRPKRVALHAVLPAGALMWVAIRAYVQLPAGVCFDDAGDLQTASATLGIMHPPGYAGFGLIGWLAGRALFWIEPARAVTLACWAAALGALWLTGKIVATLLAPQRCGIASAALGAATILALGSVAEWRDALTAPEVYAPSVCCLAAAARLALRPPGRAPEREDSLRGPGATEREDYLRGPDVQEREDSLRRPGATEREDHLRGPALYAAAALLGFVCGQRPPLLPALVGFALVAYWSGRRAEGARRRPARLILAALIAAGFTLFAPALAALHDARGAEYNYIDQYQQGEPALPAQGASLAATMERAWWLTNTVQFRFLLVRSPGEVLQRAHWTMSRIGGGLAWIGALVVLLAVLGGVRLIRCGRADAAIVALSIGVPALALLLATRMVDNAADLLPISVALALLICGLLVRAALPSAAAQRVTRLLAVGLLAASAIGSVSAWSQRSLAAREMDASWFARQLDFGTLPADAAIVTSWREATVLWHEQLLRTGRRDVQIINRDESRWAAVTEQLLRARGHAADPPIFWVREFGAPPGATLQPYRNLLRVVPDRREP